MASDKQLLHKNDNSQTVTPEPLPKRKTCTGYCVYKILTLVYAIYYVLVGLLLLALGIYVIIIKKEHESISDVVSRPAVLCLLVGIIVLVSAIVGCVGASVDRLWPLRIFLGIVIVVFIIQVVIGIVAYVYREEAIGSLESHVKTAIRRYHDDDDVKYTIDRIQGKWECCGFKEYNDWDSNQRFSCAATQRDSCSVPESCCKQPSTGCGTNVRRIGQTDQINTRGCEISFLGWIEKNLDVLGATALGFAILHILGIFVIYMLITKIEDRIRLFKYRKRFYQS